MSPISRFGCESARRRAVVVGGLRLSFLEWGNAGRPVLCFLHGGSAHAHWFDFVTPAFAERFHVIALDQRGHGESQWAEPPAYGTEHFAADLLGFIDALGLTRVTLIGHSMGGHNAMSFAAWHPECVSALVIVDSRPVIPSDRLDRLRRRGERTLRPYPHARGRGAVLSLAAAGDERRSGAARAPGRFGSRGEGRGVGVSLRSGQ